ncbi:MAG: peptidase S10 [Acidobacteriota bacterium]|nr:peptidase S10 [Acidobacteriota bacterium]
MRQSAVFVLLILASTLPLSAWPAQREPAQHPPSATTATPEKPSAEAKKQEEKEEKPVVTHHEITVHGRTLNYTATAALMPIRDPQGNLQAHMFYIAYTLDGESSPSTRPLTFCFNGGPGSSAVWLQLGAIGPRRVVLEADGHMPPPPFHLEDNQDTWLGQTDLVFIDPVGTGFSRAVKPEYTKNFWNVQGDIASVAQFIQLYLTRYERWGSPLFLAGESYGTTRAAGLSGYLMDHGIALNGIVLVSTVLNFQTLAPSTGNELPYALFLPTYSASAWYHKKLSAELEGEPLSKLMPEVVHWVSSVYAPALAQGDQLGAAGRDAVISQMSKYTGLPESYLKHANLRVTGSEFRKELLLDQNRVLGRYDTRLLGIDEPGLSAHARVDPSYSAVNPPFTEMFNNYVRSELNYKTDAPYRILSFAVNRAWSWNQPHAAFGYPNVAPSLRSALTQNPYLRVMVAEGYYDLATPFYEVEFSLDHLQLDPEYQSHVIQRHYESGHMIYINTPARDKLRQDVRTFMQNALSESGK